VLKGRVEGSATAGLDIKGAGLTGVNLQKHLVGGLNFAVTNANLKLTDGGRRKGIMNLLTSLLAAAFNIRDLRDQPIMEIAAQAKLGDGKIEVTQGSFRSASLAARMTGSIPIADDLMQSPLKLPVEIALSREVAQRARLVGADAPTNTAYVVLPPIASLKGTLGAPDAEVDKVQTALLVAKGISGLVGLGGSGALTNLTGIVGGAAKGDSNVVGNVLQNLGGLLGGKKETSTNAPATNAPVKNSIGGLLKGLLGPKTNEPPKPRP
jgi:hypothetical protein